ncbi:BspA family leucine-rich repeat surface protein, partial [Hespellia stercorisuis]
MSDKWCFLPYDFDTAIGINNEGALAFSYELEDIDTVAGADVYNGQHSVLWMNLRDAYMDDIKAMYQELRSKGKLSYADTEQRFEDHQGKWPEAIFNEDAYFKYLAPLIEDNSGAYLSMLQGSKAEQRKWWLYNRFRYLDSKYNAGDALSDVITVRGYAKDDITVTPYADIYATVKYGSYLVQKRALRGNSYLLECPLDNVNDTEIYIYSASQLKDVGDLSGLMVGYAEFSLATKLQSLKLGDSSDTYSNTNLTDLHLGKNVLLRTLDVRNCPNLTQAVDVSGCSNLEHAYFDGTGITGLLLPVGGILKTLHLPTTVTNLTIRNQMSLQEVSIPSYSNISTLRLEHVSSVVNSKEILQAIAANSRVRLIGINWEVGTADALMEMIALLDTMRGLDESGNNTEKAQVSGTISVDTVTGAQLAEIAGKYPDIKVMYQHVTSNLYFYSEDGSTLLYTQAIVDGADGTYGGSTPSKPSTAQYTYAFAGWSKKVGGAADSNAIKAVTADRNVYAAFTATVRKYMVYFYNGTTLLQTVNNVPYGGSAKFTGTAPTKTGVDDPEMYEFKGWSPSPSNIVGNTSCYAQYNYLGLPMLSKSWSSTLNSSEKSSVTKINIVDSYTPTGAESKSWDASFYVNGSVMAYLTGTVVTIAGDGSGLIQFPVDSTYIFSGLGRLTTITGMGILDTSTVTDMTSMFYNCSKLTSIDLGNFDTSTVTDMKSMFYNCSKLTSIDLGNFDTSTVTSMANMFYGCSSLT